ncbi:hypothetical protein APUTEX25_004570 [Auxenochlorella protothecoides]|uniref:Uncharacterized protein n=1 Tax=Auxenochlorella protothecoides TaxID=3075 RepID=A0A3M7L3U6_AUXPR|nr:hypothetical protein APUTEX25_004570 [Auxenochlorella protothecoides]|eukprot:RMZ56146.1 hypothetical protein APUTEX25_004570 [Auxenochlorella protothecoides]
MSRKPVMEGSTSGNPANIRLDVVIPLWLHVSDSERYLLLEDPETGDVLMPLIYMKALLEANYSRKLASLKHRVVTFPPESPLAEKDGQLYWQWAFESPHNVKVVVRKELGEENTPQGHLRVVLIPIVYNALSQKSMLRSLGLFKALHRAMKQSTYFPLLRPPPDDFMEELDAELAKESVQPPLFHGPRTIEASASKYMFMFQEDEEQKAPDTKRHCTRTGTPLVRARWVAQMAPSVPAWPMSDRAQTRNGDLCPPLPTPAGQVWGRRVEQDPPPPPLQCWTRGWAPSSPPRTHSPGSRGGDGVGPSSGPGPGLPPRLLRTLSGQAATRTPPGAVAYGQAFELGGGPLTHGQRPLRPGHGPQDVNMLALELLDVKEELAVAKRCIVQLYGMVLGDGYQSPGPTASSYPVPTPGQGAVMKLEPGAPTLHSTALAATYQRPGPRASGGSGGSGSTLPGAQSWGAAERFQTCLAPAAQYGAVQQGQQHAWARAPIPAEGPGQRAPSPYGRVGGRGEYGAMHADGGALPSSLQTSMPTPHPGSTDAALSGLLDSSTISALLCHLSDKPPDDPGAPRFEILG